MLSSRIVDT